MLGAPYDFPSSESPEVARRQAEQVAGVLVEQGGPANVQDTQIIALIAYLQRLGTDIKASNPAAQAASSTQP